MENFFFSITFYLAQVLSPAWILGFESLSSSVNCPTIKDLFILMLKWPASSIIVHNEYAVKQLRNESFQKAFKMRLKIKSRDFDQVLRLWFQHPRLRQYEMCIFQRLRSSKRFLVDIHFHCIDMWVSTSSFTFPCLTLLTNCLQEIKLENGILTDFPVNLVHWCRSIFLFVSPSLVSELSLVHHYVMKRARCR